LGSYTKDIEAMTFSFSRCHGFENCKYEWYLNYLLRDENGNRIYENEQNFYAAFGKLCHEIIEKVLKKELDKEGSVEYFSDNYESNAGYLCDSDTIKDKYYILGLSYFKQLDFSWLVGYEILGIEKECRFEIDKIKFVGYIDLLIRDKMTDEIIVIDHKSSDYPIGKRGNVLKRLADNYESYKRQLYLYSHQVYNEFGVYPSRLVWNYFKEQKLLELPFKYEEFVETNKWIKQIISEIRNEEDFIPTMNFFYCNNLCGFRNSCDYKLLED
jgi:CRISPR/Cas system-associated exonuclease Cas4 (RecB family)